DSPTGRNDQGIGFPDPGVKPVSPSRLSPTRLDRAVGRWDVHGADEPHTGRGIEMRLIQVAGFRENATRVLATALVVIWMTFNVIALIQLASISHGWFGVVRIVYNFNTLYFPIALLGSVPAFWLLGKRKNNRPTQIA